MVITDYRVQSVLRTYGKQLQRSRFANKLNAGSSQESNSEKLSISEEAKRRLIMDRVASQASGQSVDQQSENENGNKEQGDIQLEDLV
ncbi:MAG: DVU0524 family FlgM-associated protein [Syntrophobacteraceae bacterium]|jgi:hypothetical protein